MAASITASAEMTTDVVIPGFAPLADADVPGDISQDGQLLGEVGPEQRGETDEVFGQRQLSSSVRMSAR